VSVKFISLQYNDSPGTQSLMPRPIVINKTSLYQSTNWL